MYGSVRGALKKPGVPRPTEDEDAPNTNTSYHSKSTAVQTDDHATVDALPSPPSNTTNSRPTITREWSRDEYKMPPTAAMAKR
jgi:hypothetical protein